VLIAYLVFARLYIHGKLMSFTSLPESLYLLSADACILRGLRLAAMIDEHQLMASLDER
jgi:hypothetical protein